MKTIEFTVMATSLIGSALMSFAIFEGFYFFMVANILGVYFFYKSKMPYMVFMQFIFGLISINGIVRNLL